MELKGKKVAWIGADGNIEFDNSLNDIKDLITESISKWKGKRGFE